MRPQSVVNRYDKFTTSGPKCRKRRGFVVENYDTVKPRRCGQISVKFSLCRNVVDCSQKPLLLNKTLDLADRGVSQLTVFYDIYDNYDNHPLLAPTVDLWLPLDDCRDEIKRNCGPMSRAAPLYGTWTPGGSP